MMKPRHFLIAATSGIVFTATAQELSTPRTERTPRTPAVISVCRMVVVEERTECTPGAPKAEVFRYKQPAKPTKPVHASGHGQGTGEDDHVEKSADVSAAKAELRVLPNPSGGIFTLAFMLPEEGGSGELYITDAAGRVVHRELVIGNGGQARTIDLQAHGSGVYIATVVVGDHTISKRLVIDQAATDASR